MKDNKNSFIRNTIALYAMNFVKLIFPLLTLPYLTRVLSTDVYGVVTYVKALIVYVQLVIDFGFLLSATKKIVLVAENKEAVGRITGDTLVERIILGSVVAVCFLVATYVIPILKVHRVFSVLYMISVLINIFIVDFMFRGIERMHLVAIPYILAKSVITVSTFWLIKGDVDLLIIPILEIIGNGIAAVISLCLIKSLKIRISFSTLEVWLKDLKESFVYFISNFATTIFGALTTVIAGFYLSVSDIAFWGICMQVLSAAKALYNPIVNSLYPHMIRTRDIKFIHRINKIMIIPMLIGSILVIGGGKTIMQIIGGEKYIGAAEILQWLLPAFICSFYSMIYGWPVLGAVGKIKETTQTTICASLIQLMGIGIIIALDIFDLRNLAICCSVAESVLWFTRYYLYIKNKVLFFN